MTIVSEWRKSTRSGSQAECVEVGVRDATLGVRDSKNATGSVLAFEIETWKAFVGEVKVDRLVHR